MSKFTIGQFVYVLHGSGWKRMEVVGVHPNIEPGTIFYTCRYPSGVCYQFRERRLRPIL